MLLAAWYLISTSGIYSSYLLPSPEKVTRALWSTMRNGQLVKHVVSSLKRVIAGFVLSFVSAYVLALGCVAFPKASQWYDGPLQIIRTIPPLSLIPMLILWMGLGEESKIFLIILSAFFPIYMNTKEGLMACDEKLLEVGYTFGYSKWRQLWSIRIPSAVPEMISGMKISFGYSWRALVGAEMLAAASGLGYYIQDAQMMARTDKILAGIITITVVAVFCDWLIDMILRKILPEGMKRWIKYQ